MWHVTRHTPFGNLSSTGIMRKQKRTSAVWMTLQTDTTSNILVGKPLD